MKGNNNGWIGVDLDGTLATYDGRSAGGIGAPVPAMLERVRFWIAGGTEVRIFTARVNNRRHPTELAEERMLIWAWLRLQGLPKLELTCEKDFAMIELWDDRAVSVEPNTGRDMRMGGYVLPPQRKLAPSQVVLANCAGSVTPFMHTEPEQLELQDVTPRIGPTLCAPFGGE